MRPTFSSIEKNYQLDFFKIVELLDELQTTIDTLADSYDYDHIRPRDCIYIVDGKGIRRYSEVRNEYHTFEDFVGRTIRIDGEGADGNSLFGKNYGYITTTFDRLTLKGKFKEVSGLIVDPTPIYDILERYTL